MREELLVVTTSAAIVTTTSEFPRHRMELHFRKHSGVISHHLTSGEILQELMTDHYYLNPACVGSS